MNTTSYIIYKDATNVYAINGISGNADFIGIDVSTVINEVINNLETGGLIHIKAGDYILNTPIQLISGINGYQRTFILEGEGQGATRLHNNATTEAIKLQAQKSVIQNLHVTSDIANAGNGINISLNPSNSIESGTNYNTITKVGIDNVNTAIQLTGACNSNHIFDCRTYLNKGHGVTLESGLVNGTTYIPTNNRFTQVTMDRNGQTSGNQFNIVAGKNTSITNSEWFSPRANSYGIYMDDTNDTVITNIYCDSCGVYPIAIYGTNNCFGTLIIGTYLLNETQISIPNPYLWIHG